MPEIKIPKDIVVDEYGLPYDGGSEEHDVQILDDKIVDKSRWSIHHLLTVRIKDRFYQTTYSVGATEGQDEQAFEYDKEVTFTEVHQVEKIVKVWEQVTT